MGNTSASEDSFCDLFCTWNCLSNSKGFITLTAGAFPTDRRGSVRINGSSASRFCVFILLIIICWMTSLWRASFKLKFGHTRILFFSPFAKANLESLCLFRYVTYSSVASGLFIWRCGWEPSGLSLTKFCQNHRGRVHLTASQRKHGRPPVFLSSGSSSTEYCFSVCSSSRKEQSSFV